MDIETVKKNDLLTTNGRDVFQVREIRIRRTLVLRDLVRQKTIFVDVDGKAAGIFSRLAPAESGPPGGGQNPYPGVSYYGKNPKKPWRAQINRPGCHWSGIFAAAEDARDALEAKLKERGQPAIKRHEKKPRSGPGDGGPAERFAESPKGVIYEDIPVSVSDGLRKNVRLNAEGGVEMAPADSGGPPSFTWDGRTWECMRCDAKLESAGRPAKCERCDSTAMRKSLVMRK